MIAGLTPFTVVHVLISLGAIASGFVVLYGLVHARRMNDWAAIYIGLSVATDVTGFFFPFRGVTPAIILGILSLIVLGVAIVGRYVQNLRGAGRILYAVGAIVALYFNCFVLVVQAFQKVPVLNALAPKGNEPPFAIVQGIVLLFFIASGFVAVRRFRPRPV